MYLFGSDSSDAPKLNNTWGDFNKLINYAIDGSGGQTYDIASFAYYEDNKAKIKFKDNATPFLKYQTIILKSDSYEMNFFIDKIDVDNTYIVYNKDVSNTILNSYGANIKARFVKSGLTRVFGGISDNRTVFKLSKGLHIRVDDIDYSDKTIFPQSTATLPTNGRYAKVARVCVSDSFTSLDSSTGRMYPYNENRSNENFAPDGDYVGQQFVCYNYRMVPNQSDYYMQSAYMHNDSNDYLYNRACRYKCYVSKNGIILLLLPDKSANVQSTVCYIFTEYDDFSSNQINGYIQCLKTDDFNMKYSDNIRFNPFTNDNTYGLKTPFPSNISTNNHPRLAKYIYNGGSNNTVIVYQVSSMSPSSSESGVGPLKYPNPINNKVYISDIMLTDGANLYGKYYDLKWVNHNVNNNSIIGTAMDTGKIIKYESDYYIVETVIPINYITNAGGTPSKFLIRLDR